MLVDGFSETTFLKYLLNVEKLDELPPAMTNIQHFILKASLVFLKTTSDWYKDIESSVENLYQKQLTYNKDKTYLSLNIPGVKTMQVFNL